MFCKYIYEVKELVDLGSTEVFSLNPAESPTDTCSQHLLGKLIRLDRISLPVSMTDISVATNQVGNITLQIRDGYTDQAICESEIKVELKPVMVTLKVVKRNKA